MEENNSVAPTRRRRHSAEFKAEAVKACMQPGVSIAAVALHYRLNANMLRTWVSAHEERVSKEPARASMSIPTAEFIPLPLASAHAPAVLPDIVIEVRRGASAITIRWPHAAAAECAGWLHGWLR
jgi:transposase-like protein